MFLLCLQCSMTAYCTAAYWQTAYRCCNVLILVIDYLFVGLYDLSSHVRIFRIPPGLFSAFLLAKLFDFYRILLERNLYWKKNHKLKKKSKMKAYCQSFSADFLSILFRWKLLINSLIFTVSCERFYFLTCIITSVNNFVDNLMKCV